MGLLDFKNTLQQVKKDLLEKPKDALLGNKNKILGVEENPEETELPDFDIFFWDYADDTATPIEEFINIVQNIENSIFSEAEQQDIKLMVTQFRKSFYDGESWDKYLLPLCASISPKINSLKEY